MTIQFETRRQVVVVDSRICSESSAFKFNVCLVTVDDVGFG
jgi:hypothetical protein